MRKTLLFTLTKADFEITYYSGSGAGGQHRNKHQNCVRMRHPESDVSAIGADHKSREQNKKLAFRRLTNHPEFKKWIKFKALYAQDVERRVDESMRPENILVEYETSPV